MKLRGLSLAGLAVLARASLAQDYSPLCNEQCRNHVADGAAYEHAQHADTSPAFYKAPANFSTKLPPGSVLAIEVATALDNYAVPNGLTLSRILYTTNDLNGTILPASAYILWPYAPLEQPDSQEQGLPLVAWAHGTSGLFRACAPSNYRNLQYHFMAPFALALQGIAVVAPDYAGLGVGSLPSGAEILHPWLAGPLQANDLAHAVTAARAAFPTLLRPAGPFVALGHSQGGAAAWGLAERQARRPLPGYRGTVALAPAVRIFDQLDEALHAHAAGPTAAGPIAALGIAPKLIAGVTAAFPAYNYAGFTSLTAYRWHKVLKPKQGCLPADTLAFDGVTPEDLAVRDWQEHPTVRAYANLSRLGGRELQGPMLVITGDVDVIVSAKSVEGAADETCRFPQRGGSAGIELITYKGAGHFPLIQASQGRWMNWVKERLRSPENEKLPACSKKTVEGLRSAFSVPAQLPNFLVTWAPAAEFWKYLL